MDKTLLKLTYLKYYYKQKSLTNHKWPNLTKHELELILALQNKIHDWNRTLSSEEYEYLRKFENTKFNKFMYAKNIKLITDIDNHFVFVQYTGNNWYSFKPNKVYNTLFRDKAHGLTELHNKLQSYQLWSKVDNNIIGID